MIIHTQCDANHTRIHVLGGTVVFLLCYTLALALMHPNSSISLFTTKLGGMYPDLEPIPIKTSFEVLFYILIALFQINLFMLQRFLIRYRYYLMDRGKKMHRLQMVNRELQDKLIHLDQEPPSSSTREAPLDLDSPITKVIQMIRDIQIKMVLPEVIESLEYAIQLLSSNKLFQVDLNNFKENLDNDLKAWLNNLLRQNENEPEPSIELPALKEEGSIQFHQTKSSPSSQTDALVPDPRVQDALHFDVDMKVNQVLSKSQSWDFNCFDLAIMTNGQPLFYLTRHLLKYYDLFSSLKLDRFKVEKCLTQIEKGYRLNPYHNSIHACDVTQTFHFFLSTMHLGDQFTPEEILACILAAAIHDLDHPGVNNVYLLETRHPLCLRYNDQSILENHHCTKGFEWLLVHPETNFLADLPLPSVRHIRQCVIKMVLATDMVGHFEHVSKFKNKLQSQGIILKDMKDRFQVMELGLKCADISNPTKSPALAQKWTELVLAEFFLQGDLERERGMNISKFMDRTVPSVSKCQLGFMDFIVSPMYELWAGFLSNLLIENQIENEVEFPALENITANRNFWKSFNDPPPSSTPLTISSIPTPEYLIVSLSAPLNLTISPASFVLRSTVCKSLPSPAFFSPLSKAVNTNEKNEEMNLNGIQRTIELGPSEKSTKLTI